MGKKKLLVLASTYPRWALDTEPAFVEKLSQQLSEKYEVHVLAPHYKGACRSEILNGIQVYRYRYGPAAWQKLAYEGGILENLKRLPFLFFIIPLFLMGQLLAIRQLHKENSYDALHAHWIIPQGIIAVLHKVLFDKRLPILITSHGGDLFALNGRLMKKLKSWVLSRSSHITVVSKVMKAHVVGLGIDPAKVSVRSMGVELCNSFTIKEGLFRDPKLLVYVGRLVEKKGVEYLINAFRDVRLIYPDVKLKIIGAGPLSASLTALTTTLNIDDSVEFVGSVNNSEIPSLLNKASIAVVPSIIAESGDQEGLGLVIIEALGCGCSVIASDLPAIRDVITHGETGLLVSPADSGALASTIVSALEDPDRMIGLAARGRSRVSENFDWKSVGLAYSKLIGQIINDAKK
mgnify:CR=1 FL=1